jgi:hypothetical protein
MPPRSPLLAVIACLTLSACASMPLASMARLSRVDMRTTDIAALGVGVRLPSGLRPAPGGVKLNVSVKAEGDVGESAAFVLDSVDAPADRSGLPPAVEDGFATYAFRLAPADVARVATMRAKAIAMHDAGEKGSFSMTVDAQGVCAAGAVPGRELTVSTYLRTAETGGYVAVAKDIDLVKALPDAAVPAFPACPS